MQGQGRVPQPIQRTAGRCEAARERGNPITLEQAAETVFPRVSRPGSPVIGKRIAGCVEASGFHLLQEMEAFLFYAHDRMGKEERYAAYRF